MGFGEGVQTRADDTIREVLRSLVEFYVAFCTIDTPKMHQSVISKTVQDIDDHLYGNGGA